LKEGYSTKLKYYDPVNKGFLIFDVESLTSTGDQSIILKGKPQEENFVNDNKNLTYNGKIDADNMHNNYNYSAVQNERNLVDLMKIGLEIEMSLPNYNLYRFQKILVLISEQTPTPLNPMWNNRLSGEWLIIDIVYRFDNKKYTQILRLIKKELDLSAEELAKEEQQTPRIPASENTSNNTEQTTNDLSSQTPNEGDLLVGATSSVTQNDDNFPLTKDIFRKIYEGKANNKIIELYYEPMKRILKQYGIDNKNRIAAFLSQINIESDYLKIVSSNNSNEFENRPDLGNVSPGDGEKYKPRGLFKVVGRTEYKLTGDYLGKDFRSNLK
jgi:hypothetical protein